MKQHFSNPYFIYLLDNDNYTIDLFDLKSKQVAERISFQREGPDKLYGNLISFDVIGEDSLLLLNDTRGLFLFDGNGKKIWEKYIDDAWFKNGQNLPLEQMNFFSLGIPNYLSLPFHYDRQIGCFYVLTIWQPSWRNTEALWDEFSKPVLAKVNIADESGEFVGGYPFDLNASRLPFSILPHFALWRHSPVIVYDYHPKLFYQDSFYCSKSLFDKGDFELYNKGKWLGEDEEVRPYHTDQGYLGIYFDRYRNVFYRVFQHGQTNESVDGIYNQKLNAPFSLMVLDTTFHVIGEVVFPKEIYNFLDIIVLPEGILLSTENPYNPLNVEDVYEFHLLRISFPTTELE